MMRMRQTIYSESASIFDETGQAPPPAAMPCQFCLSLVYARSEHFTVPLFNLVVGIIPFAYLFVILLRAEASNDASAQARARPSYRRLDLENGAEASASRDSWMSDSSHLRLLPPAASPDGNHDGCCSCLRDRLSLAFTGILLPQYFVLLRWLAVLDMFIVFIVLIASTPDDAWFRVVSMLLRACYRWLEYIACFALVAPLTRCVDDPRRIQFSWKYVVRVSAPMALLMIVLDAAAWWYCPDFVPQFDFTFARLEATNATVLYRRYVEPLNKVRGWGNDYAWTYRDAIDLVVFAMFGVASMGAYGEAARGHLSVRTGGDDDSAKRDRSCCGAMRSRMTLALRSIFGDQGRVHPRPALRSFAPFLVLVRLLRLVGDMCAGFMSNEAGGPFLCLYAAAYFLEQALFAPLIFSALAHDTQLVLNRGSEVSGWFQELDAGTDEIDAIDIELGALIGKGQCKVYRGLWHGCPVAVKRIPYTDFKDKKRGSAAHEGVEQARSWGRRLRATIQEVHILRRCCHPNVVQYLGYAVDCVGSTALHPRDSIDLPGTDQAPKGTQADLELWIVQELLERMSLFDLIGEGAAARDPAQDLTLARKFQLCTDFVRGMTFLSEVQGVLHRDLKSLNIFVDQNFHAKVGDFGESHVIGAGEALRAPSKLRLYGSLEWMAPEVLTSAKYSRASDVYSAGVVLWEVFECQRPYEELAYETIPDFVLRGERLGFTGAATPQAVRELIERCWGQDAAERPSFGQLLRLLDEARAQTMAMARVKSDRDRYPKEVKRSR